MVFSPLEQFALISLIPFHLGNLYLSFTNSSLFMLLTVSFVLLLFYLVTLNGGRLAPNAWQSFVEILYDFVLNLVLYPSYRRIGPKFDQSNVRGNHGRL